MVPSLKAVRALDAVARLGSVRGAAEELKLTRSAVSHQLRFLETALGFSLTEREGRGVRLTLRGERYAREVRGALRILSQAQARSGEERLSGRLTVSCTPGFATYWLCPRIAAFADEYPDVELNLVLPRRLDEVTAPDVDLFIAYGQGDWSSLWTELLSELEFTPVCSPALINSCGGLREPRDLADCKLLHLAGQNDWARWLAATRVLDIDAERGITFSDVHLLLSAALAGQGVAMGDSLTCSRSLKAGSLVRPFAVSIKAPAAYYFVAHPGAMESGIARTFVDWVREQLGSSIA